LIRLDWTRLLILSHIRIGLTKQNRPLQSWIEVEWCATKLDFWLFLSHWLLFHNLPGVTTHGANSRFHELVFTALFENCLQYDGINGCRPTSVAASIRSWKDCSTMLKAKQPRGGGGKKWSWFLTALRRCKLSFPRVRSTGFQCSPKIKKYIRGIWWMEWLLCRRPNVRTGLASYPFFNYLLSWKECPFIIYSLFCSSKKCEKVSFSNLITSGPCMPYGSLPAASTLLSIL
jgi:hypothetical protein